MGPANTHKTNNVENNIIKLVVNLVHLLYNIYNIIFTRVSENIKIQFIL